MAASSAWVPDLTVALAQKAQGGALFKEGEYEAADAAYAAAVEAVRPQDRSWPQAESLVTLCLSNRAMCLLKLGGQAAQALPLCDVGLAQPGVAQATDIHAKLLARRAQACLECTPPRPQEAAEALYSARSRGLWPKTGGMSSKFQGLARRLPAPGLPPPKPLPNDCPGHMPLQLAIAQLVDLKSLKADDLVVFFGGLLADQIMKPSHPCAVDPKDGGTLLWGLCYAISENGGDAAAFSRLLKLFVKEFSVPINMRMEKGRTALIYAASSYKMGLVAEVLQYPGVDPQLRDDEGWYEHAATVDTL